MTQPPLCSMSTFGSSSFAGSLRPREVDTTDTVVQMRKPRHREVGLLVSAQRQQVEQGFKVRLDCGELDKAPCLWIQVGWEAAVPRVRVPDSVGDQLLTTSYRVSAHC